MTWTLCTSGSAISKAGVARNAAIVASGSALAGWSDQAEAAACAIARSDVITNFGALTANGKQVLQDFCASWIAQQIVAHDLLGYGSQRAAETILDLLDNNITSAEKLIKEDKNKTFLGIT